MNINYEEDHGGGSERIEDTPLSLRDARLQSDLEAIVDQQKKKIQEDSLGDQVDAIEHQRLVEESFAELTDTSEAHIFLRAAQELIPEKEMNHSYSMVIRLAIAYIRIGEIEEAMRLVDQLDLPTEKYEQNVVREEEVKDWNPLYIGMNATKFKKRKTQISKWKFKDSQDETYEHYERMRWRDDNTERQSAEDSALSAAYQNTTSTHERQFKKQLRLDKSQNMPELQGMSPKEYVMAMIAYYSNWMGGISTKENVQKFASTLTHPEKDFEVYDDSYGEDAVKEDYMWLKEKFEKDGPASLKEVLKTREFPKGHNRYATRKVSNVAILNFLTDLAVQKYHENQHDVADDEEKELIST